MSEAEARRAVEAFFEGFNARDVAKMRDAFNFPHVRLASGRVVVVESAEQFRVPFDALVAAEGWHHSTLDSITAVHARADKVHFDVRFSRYHEDGTRYASYETLWVVTRQEGHWGVQARSSFAP